MNQDSNDKAFPILTKGEIARIEALGTRRRYSDGEYVFQAGQPGVDLFIVLEGEIQIVNPWENDSEIVVQGQGQFSGDIDLLTGRPVIVSGIARNNLQVLQVPNIKVREVLLRVPQISEKFMTAFQLRRDALSAIGKVGIRVVGSADCKHTNVIREFLAKNFVPFVWFDLSSKEGDSLLKQAGPGKCPIVDCGGGKILQNPSLLELAECAGLWRDCPTSSVDLAIIGAGPAGLSAAVYAGSEGISTLVIDALGPGGQAAASSRIENFIGFPSGLSGTELATRAVMQMLKFGVRVVTPVLVEKLDCAREGEEFHRLHLNCGAVLEARIVLIASGMAWRKPAAVADSKFEMTGIYYACTSTEALAHHGQDIGVIGAGNSAGQAAMYLAEQCANLVHLIVRGNSLTTSMSSYLVDRILDSENIKVHFESEVTKVNGEDYMSGVTIHTKDRGESDIPLNALFVFIGAEPQVSWLPDEILRDEKGFILTGSEALDSGKWPLSERAPCQLETSVPNILAVGDVRSNSTKRVGFAVGDGALAVACIHTLNVKG